MILIRVESIEHQNYNFYIRLFIYFHIYLSGFMKEFAPYPGTFFSKVDDIKLKGMEVSFFPTPFIFLSLLSFPYFLPFFLRGLEAAFRSCEIKLHMGDLAQIINTVFIYPVRYVIIRFTYDQRLCQLIQLLNVEIRSVRPSVQCPERNLQITKIHTFHYVLVKHKFSSTFESNK